MHFSLQISTFGHGAAPCGWTIEKRTEMQRLYYIKGGSGAYLRGDGQWEAFRSGCFYLFPYNFRAVFTNSTEQPVDHVYFDFVSMPPLLAAEPLCIPAGSTVLSALAQLLTQSVPSHNCADFETGEALLRMTLRLLEKQVCLPFSTDALIAEALRRIWDGYAGPLCIAELAAAVHLEENHFIRRFRRVMGQTPYAYLRTYRLTLAKQALLCGDTLAQAAEKVGYQSAASLSRALRSAEI